MPVLRVNDAGLYFESHGSGEPVLFLHGLGGAGSDWNRQIPAFTGYRSIAMDVRGHARSAKPPGPYSVAQFAADAVELLRALDAAPAHVIGLSMGGMIAFQMAVDFPQALRSVTIVNSGPELILRTPAEQQAIQARHTIVHQHGMAALAKLIAAPLFPNPEQTAMLQEFETEIASNDPRAYLDSLSAITGWSVADQIGEIRCPVLIVSSDQDYTPVEWKRAYAAKIPDARVEVLENSRHVGNIDQSGSFNRIVLDFLNNGVLRRH